MASTSVRNEREARIEAIARRVEQQEGRQHANGQNDQGGGVEAFTVTDENGRLLELAGSLSVAAGYQGVVANRHVRFKDEHYVAIWPVADDEFRPSTPLDVPAFQWPPIEPDDVEKIPRPLPRAAGLRQAARFNLEVLDAMPIGAVPHEWAVVLQFGEVVEQTITTRLADDYGLHEFRRVSVVRIIRPTITECHHYAKRAKGGA